MKRTTAMALAVVASAAFGTGADAPREAEAASPPLARLTVSVSGLEPGRGAVMVALFDGKTEFPSFKGQVAARRVAVAGRTTDAVFDAVPYGRYAVAVFYDRNNNGKLDTRLGAIPVEPLGFSNGAKIGLFGPPAYKEAAFDLNSKERAIRISVR